MADMMGRGLSAQQTADLALAATSVQTSGLPLGVGSGGTGASSESSAQLSLLLGHRPSIPGGTNQFTTARSVFLTTPEYGWTVLNRTALTSANENTTTANAFHGVHGATNTDWTNGGNWTAPARVYTIDYAGGPLEIIGLCYSNGAANYEQSGILVYDTSNKNNFIKAGVGYSATRGGISVECYLGALQNAAITAGQRNAGVWVRIVLDGLYAAVYYNVNAASDPAGLTWTLLTSGNSFGMWKTLAIGTMMQTVNTAGTLTGGCKWFGWSHAGVGYITVPSFQATQ